MNASRTRRRGTIRGLHYQQAPYEEAKFVRCTRGALYDVILDLRPDSPSRYRWVGLELSAKVDRTVYIPAGCAHGFQTLEDDTEMTYAVSEFYHPEVERGVRWNDPAFGIIWPIADVILSEKDLNLPLLAPELDECIHRVDTASLGIAAVNIQH
jgi:dTDP-4-dehydrorhamnose 3,5-epimerase